VPDKELGIELTAKERVSQATGKVARSVSKATGAIKKIPGVAKRAGSALKAMGERGAKALEGLTQKLFFFKEALNTVANAARGLFEAFIQPALAAESTEAALANLTGSGAQASRMMDDMRRVAKDTGVNLAELYGNATNLAESFRAQGKKLTTKEWDSYLSAIKKVARYRPDLTAAEQIGIVNEMMAGNMEAAAEQLGKSEEKIRAATEAAISVSEQGLGMYTSVVRREASTAAESLEEIGASAEAVDKALDSLDMIPVATAPAKIAIDKLKAAWDIFRETVGMRVLDKVVEALSTLIDWLTKNEDKVVALAEKIGDLLVTAVKSFLEWLTPERLDKIAASIGNIAGTVQGLIESFLNMPEWAQKLLIGGAMALGPLGGGKALLGGAAKMLGGALGGGGAAAGAGTAAAGGTGVAGAAAGAGGLAAGGVALAGLAGAAVGGLGYEAIARSKWGQEKGMANLQQFAAVGAHGLGKMFGGEEMGREWFSKIAGIGGSQQVEVIVSVDDSGAIQAYTNREIGRNNTEMVTGMGMRPSAAWGAR